MNVFTLRYPNSDVGDRYTPAQVLAIRFSGANLKQEKYPQLFRSSLHNTKSLAMGISKQRTEPSRANRKAKKRKLEDAIPDLPGDDDAQEVSSAAHELGIIEKPSKKRKRTNEEAETQENPEVREKKRKSSKKERKQKEENVIVQAVDIGNGDGVVKKSKKSKKEEANEESSAVQNEADETDDAPKKSKKERKAERKAREAADKANDPDRNEPMKDSNGKAEVKANAVDTSTSTEEKKRKNNRNREKKRKTALENGLESKPPRFIAFIGKLDVEQDFITVLNSAGNLPYSATAASLQKHFASVKPKSVRHPTEKDNPQKSKGYAFIEFEGYDHMKTCLKLFHHSMFDDGVSPPRKINVELT
jgi:nucleolar protein 6